LDALSAAIAERGGRLDKRVRLRAVAIPDGFVAGEETALIQFLNRGLAKPTFTPPLPFERGVGKAPTLVQNVETLAQLALIARLGGRAVVVLPTSACGICETARAMRYLADSSAGQCGPCIYGLDAIARSFERLAARQRLDERKQLKHWIQQVRGRGACSHPDG